MTNYNKNIDLDKNCDTDRRRKRLLTICICFFAVALITIKPIKTTAAENSISQDISLDGSNSNSVTDNLNGELHAFYPSNAVYSEQIQKYIDDVDSLSFAWSRIDSEDPGALNIVKGKNDNFSFYYPADFIKPVEYARSKGKSIQLNIYMDKNDCILLLPEEEKRIAMIKAIVENLQTDITQGKEIYYDGVVIDFEGLSNTDAVDTQILYKNRTISTYFTQFLKELKTQLTSIEKKLYVAVNPGLYYDGYDYADILDVADRVILMAHDYEPTERLQKNQVQQYTGYNALEPVNSMAPMPLVREALNDMAGAASDTTELSKVWLQITFDSAQWQYNIENAEEWESLDSNTLSREGRVTPLYQSIKARVDNSDGHAENLTYGYNNELQSPYLQYFNTSSLSWNIILYEDSVSIKAKIDLAAAYGLGGISLWSLANVPDYTDAKGLKYHLDGWTTIVDEMNTYDEKLAKSSEAVEFTDSYVEQAVREKLGKITGEITMVDVKDIYRLKLPKGVKSLIDLKYLTNLEYLDAQQLGIKDITDVGRLKNLRVLYLQRNNISDISALKKLKKLEVLSLNGNQVVTISTIASLTRIRELYLRENKITSITALAKLSNLEILEAGMNNITKIDALLNLQKLQELALDNNRIADIAVLKGLNGLETLYLQRNVISKITPLTGLHNLKMLSLNGNSIYDLKPLAKLTSLEKLYLKDNKISSVTLLKGLKKLNELYLAGNKISDYSPLRKLYLKSDFNCDFVIR